MNNTTRSFQEIINDSKPVLIDYFAEWCGPCKMMAPILTELKNRLGERIHIIKIDVDKNPQLAAKEGVRGVPTLALYQSGNRLWRKSGVIPATELERMIQEVVPL